MITQKIQDSMKIIQELLQLLNAVTEAEEPVNFGKLRDAAYARSKWHKSQAQKHKGEDEQAYEAHSQAETDWLMISQEYTHKNLTIANRAIARAEEKLSKSKVAREETDAKYPNENA